MQYFKFPKQPNYKLIAALLFLFTFVLFGNTIMNDYNMDDELVTKNHRLTSRGISAIPDIFTSSYYADDMGYAYEYRPVVLTSFAIEHTFFGEDPQISHFFNVLLYALLSVLLFFLIVKLLPDIHYGFAFVVTLLFLAHPLHTEVVASIKNRDEILALMGGLGAWYFALRYTSEHKWYQLIFIALLFIAGAFSKLSVLPFALIIPVSLVLFTKVNATRLLIISVLFSSILVWVTPLFSFTLQLLVFLSGVSIPQFLYFIKNKNLNDFDFSKVNLKNKSLINIPIPNFLLYPAIVVIIVSSAIGLLLNFMPLIYFSFIFSLLCNLISNVNSRKYLSIPLALASGVSIFVLSSSYVLIAITLYYSVMAIHYEKENRNIHLIAMALLLPMFFVMEVYSFILLIPLVYVFYTYFKKSKYYDRVIKSIALIVIVTFAIDAILNIVSSFFGDLEDDFSFLNFAVQWIIVFGLMIVVYYTQIVKYIPKILLGSLFLFYLMNFPYSESVTKARDIEQDVNKAVQISPTITLSTDRPLEIIETPVTSDAPTDVRIATSADILLRYLKLTVFPHPLSFYYGYAEVEAKELKDFNVILSFIIHLALLTIALFFLKKHPIASFGILFYLLSISVYSNYLYPIPGGIGERLAFTATLGFCILVAYILFVLFKTDFSSKYRVDIPKYMAYTLGVILLLYSYKTITRNALWENEVKLFSNDIQYVSQSAQAHNLLALNLIQSSFNMPPAEQNRTLRKALEHFERSLEIYPDFFNVYYDKGRTYMILEEWDKALESFQYVMDQDPSFTRPFFQAASIHKYRGERDKAVKVYETLIEKNPHNVSAYNNLGAMYYETQNYEKAAEISKLTIQNIPDHPDGYINLGKSYYMMGRYDDAIQVLHQGLEVKPDNHEILEGLGASYQMIGDNQRSQYYMNESHRYRPVQ